MYEGEERCVHCLGEKNLWEREHLEDPGVDGRIILSCNFGKWVVRAWTESSWLRIGACGGHLWMRLWTFGFHKMWGISWLAENRLASQEGLCSMNWVSEWLIEWVNEWVSELVSEWVSEWVSECNYNNPVANNIQFNWCRRQHSKLRCTPGLLHPACNDITPKYRLSVHCSGALLIRCGDSCDCSPYHWPETTRGEGSRLQMQLDNSVSWCMHRDAPLRPYQFRELISRIRRHHTIFWTY